MAQTPHVNEDGRVYTLAAGDNSWPALLAAQGPAGLHLSHAEFRFRVEAGGPVSHAAKASAMAAIGEGESYAVGAGAQQGVTRGVIDGTLQRFFATNAGDKIFIYARNR